jgi:PKD repeat protein
LRTVIDGVNAANATGAFALSNVTVRNASDDGLDATNASRAWTATGLTVRDAGDVGVEAIDAAGAWSLSNASVESTAVGVLASNADGAWTLRNVSIRDAAGSGVNAFQADGNWTVRSATVDNATVGVVALLTDGDWLVASSTLRNLSGARAGVPAAAGRTAVYAVDATGAWTVRESAFLDGAVGVNATRAVRGDARRNWWGQSAGPTAGQCVGNVTCRNHLPFREPLAGTSGVAADPNDDGVYEDVDGDGAVTFADVVTLFESFDEPRVRAAAAAFDSNGNGRLDFDDLVGLFRTVGA